MRVGIKEELATLEAGRTLAVADLTPASAVEESQVAQYAVQLSRLLERNMIVGLHILSRCVSDLQTAFRQDTRPGDLWRSALVPHTRLRCGDNSTALRDEHMAFRDEQGHSGGMLSSEGSERCKPDRH